MPYLEIYPMENSANKIANQLDLVLETKPRMYSKTIDRYKQLAQSLLQSVAKISSILEEESLMSDGHIHDEFNELSHTCDGIHELTEAVEAARTQISSYTQFTAHASDSSHLSNKDILSAFAKVLEESSQYEFSCPWASECAKLIYKWFSCRFTPKLKNPNFRYNIEYIPTWITYIIVLYGWYHSTNRTSVLISMFDDWCNAIQNDFSNCYAVPYEVYRLMKTVDPDAFTMNGVLIGDILIDECYYQLTASYFLNSNVCLDGYTVAALTKVKNPSLLPEIRVRIAKKDELLSKYNLIH